MPRRPSRAIAAFLLLGLVSLTADMTYEGARSVGGSLIEILGASAVVAGIAAFGELASGLTRYLSGYAAYSLATPRAYWGLVFLGYTVNLIAAPALAFTGRWWEALTLIMLERVGKGLRAPVRDVILAETSESLGRGLGYGIHEVLDQIGAVAGPVLVWLIASEQGLRMALASLAVPAAASLTLLFLAYTLYPRPRAASKRPSPRGLSIPGSQLYLSITLMFAGLSHWALVAYACSVAGVSPGTIALLYALAMAVDALTALALGTLYDRLGAAVLLAMPVSAMIATTLLLTSREYTALLIGASLWGLAMGVAESPLKAFVADSSRDTDRALAFSWLGLSMGMGWGFGTLVLSVLVSRQAILVLMLYIVTAEILSLALLLRIRTGLPMRSRGAFNNRGER